ncbi:hypothetical protein BLKGLAD_66010 [Burkholderia gladioli pv. gladioli]
MPATGGPIQRALSSRAARASVSRRAARGALQLDEARGKQQGQRVAQGQHGLHSGLLGDGDARGPAMAVPSRDSRLAQAGARCLKAGRARWRAGSCVPSRAALAMRGDGARRAWPWCAGPGACTMRGRGAARADVVQALARKPRENPRAPAPPRFAAAPTRRAGIASPSLARKSLDSEPRGAKRFASSSGSLGFRSRLSAMPGPRAFRSCRRPRPRSRRGSTEG